MTWKKWTNMDEEVVYEIELDEMDNMDEGHGKVMDEDQPESYEET